MSVHLLITRKWHNPEIEISILKERPPDGGIEIKVKIDDFIKVLVEEMGNPSFLLTKKQLESRMRSVLPEVFKGFKKETERVI